jgi:hypothetical protein
MDIERVDFKPTSAFCSAFRRGGQNSTLATSSFCVFRLLVFASKIWNKAVCDWRNQSIIYFMLSVRVNEIPIDVPTLTMFGKVVKFLVEFETFAVNSADNIPVVLY